MSGHPKSKTPPQQRDLFATQVATFKRIQQIANIQFVHDVCAQAWSAKTASYWTKRDNALKIKWTDYLEPLSPVWMNPPYSNLPAWTEKAAREAADGLIVMGLVPDSRSSAWYRHNLDGVASVAYTPDGRINFVKPGGEIWRGNMWPSVFPLWTPWVTGHTHYSYFYREPVHICPFCHSNKTDVVDVWAGHFEGDVVECKNCYGQAPAEQWRQA